MSNEILYLLRVAKGVSHDPDVVLRRGEVRPVFGAGTHATWRVQAAGVAASHVLFAFNGRELYVAAAPGARASMDGAPLATRWERVTRTSQLELGSARIAILPRPAVLRARADAATRPERRRQEEASTVDADADVLEALRRGATPAATRHAGSGETAGRHAEPVTVLVDGSALCP